MAIADDLNRVVRRQSAYIDDVIGDFRRVLDQVIDTAKARTLARSLQRGDNDRADLALLQRLARTWRDEMTRAGAGAAIEAAVGKFAGQFAFFEQTLSLLGRPPIIWTPRDRETFTFVQQGTIETLDSVIDAVGQRAKRQALFSVGAMPLPELAELLAGEYETTLPQAISLADTSMSTFYRQVQERGYERIEATQKAPLKYRYFGPNDKLTRPFCLKLLKREEPLTRKQIDALDNGQLPNTFVTGGGYNCRHQWIISTE